MKQTIEEALRKYRICRAEMERDDHTIAIDCKKCKFDLYADVFRRFCDIEVLL